MELTKKDFNAKSVGEFMGLTQDEIAALARRNAPAFNRYIKAILGGDEEAGYEENVLFSNIIKNCETLEQALFLAFNFKHIVETLFQKSVDQIISKN